MAKLNRKQIQIRALELLEQSVGGIRWGQLLKIIHTSDPETPQNSIHGSLQILFSNNDEIAKVARGTYQLTKYLDAQATAAINAESETENKPIEIEGPQNNKITLLESDFYDSFAEWLVDVAEEANEAEALGGSLLKGKWGTPDVIGVLKSRADDILKFPTQIVAAEIKIDPSQTVTAFGQAIAYRLFSHKSYMVLPNTLTEDDLNRLKAMSTIHGVGLVTFTLDKGSPDFILTVPAASAEPDMFYANQMAKRLKETSPKMFHRFFS